MLTEPRLVTGRAPVDAEAAGIGRAAVAGACVGFLVVLTLVGGIVLAAGAGVVSALGVGAFVALWGGPGWGGMVGAVRYADGLRDQGEN
jgi:hypothetical protein